MAPTAQTRRHCYGLGIDLVLDYWLWIRHVAVERSLVPAFREGTAALAR
jgi:hypothetical protein